MQLKNYINSKLGGNTSSGTTSATTSNNVSSSIVSEQPKKGHAKSLSMSNVTPIMKFIKEICHLSRVGYSGEGVKKVNQDIYFLYENFNDNPNDSYMGVW